MRTSRRIVIGVAVSGLVATGGVTFGLIANANTQAFCDGSGTPVTCTIPTQMITSPSEIQVSVTLESGSAQTVTVTWFGRMLAQRPGDTDRFGHSSHGYADYHDGQHRRPAALRDAGLLRHHHHRDPQHHRDLPDGPGLDAGGLQQLVLGPPPPPSTHVSTVSGYGGKCVDDRGNSSSNKTEIIIWSCNSSDSAQGWTFSGGELKHNNHCANIQGNGGSGSKLILWSCTGASNEKWFHSSSDGEYVSAGTAHGLLCVDDPGYSKTNGTELIVYKCHNSSNQHWSA